jgi:tetratricopeptide (TPR) repeat protein/glycosyltransferase involved in cell wall biosynthesis
MEISEKFQSALTYYQDGNIAESITVCGEIIKTHPENTDALILLGLLHHQSHEHDMAATYFERAIECEPDNFYAFFYLGNIYHEKGDLEKASACFQKTIEINPSFGDAYYNHAIILEKKDELEKALISYKKSLAFNPDLADSYNNLGNVLLKMKRFDEAVPYLRNALRINPSYVLSFNNLAMALKGQGHLDEAISHLQKAIEINPSFADAYCNLAIILMDRGKVDDAISNFQKAIETNPSFADAYYNLATILKDKKMVDEAISLFQKAIEINPSFANAYCSLAIISEESGMLDEALTYYQKALQINPEDAETHWNMSFALLSIGNFKQGWREYEWRFEVKDFKHRSLPIPRWDGSSLEGKNLFIQAEQGIGEEIMFASCLPEVMTRADLCIVECDKRLVPLFSRSFPHATMIDRRNADEVDHPRLPQADMKIAGGSLPFFLRPHLSSFPQCKAYLVPDTYKVELWRNRFRALGNNLKVGISWRGGGITSEKRLRSTVLDQWDGLLTIPGIHYINLQYGDCSQELAEVKEKFGVTIHHWEDADPLKDLDGFAAQVSALDLVISVDNATVHMAGALGIPVWTMLPYACDWRWMRDFEDTPWYKTVRLIRQTNPGDWSIVFERLASNLRQYAATGVMPETTLAHSYKNTLKDEYPLSLGHSPSTTLSNSRTHRCAIVTPVGPGHKELYRECLESVNKSFSGKKGLFSDIIPIRINDFDGKLGRSKARNIGIKKAAGQNADWIFFLDADDIMAPSAFEYVSEYLGRYDAVWGSIWTIERGELKASERPHQLPFLYSIDDLISYDPFVTLQIGHFVKTSVALSVLFNESLDIGEDFDYYLRVWENYACIKIPLPFFYNRRGLHSQGPRSSKGSEWNLSVEKIIKKRRSECRLDGFEV